MASSNKTDKLQLPQWELNDKPEMADFNDAFNKVEDFKDEFDSHKAETINAIFNHKFTGISANSSTVFDVPIEGLKTGNAVAVNFLVELPTGLIPVYSVPETGVLRVKLYNVTSEYIPLATRSLLVYQQG